MRDPDKIELPSPLVALTADRHSPTKEEVESNAIHANGSQGVQLFCRQSVAKSVEQPGL